MIDSQELCHKGVVELHVKMLPRWILLYTDKSFPCWNQVDLSNLE